MTDIMQHISLILRRSQQSRILQAPQHYKDNRLLPLDFIFYWRYYLGLPRLIRPGRPTAPIPAPKRTDLDESQIEELTSGNPDWAPLHAEICSLRHAKPGLLCPTASHSISCASTFGARYRTHNSYSHILARASRAAGASANIEPSTKDLLLNEFSSAELRSLCPKRLTKASRQRSSQLKTLIEQMALLPAEDPALDPLLDALKTILASTPADTKGVRLDLAIEFPNGEEIWCDFTGIHATQASMSNKLTQWLRESHLADFVSSGVTANNPLARTPSPAVDAAVKAKLSRYELMLELATQQRRSRRRSTVPTFAAAVVTHTGELSSGMIKLIERITQQATTSLSKGPASLGLSKKRFSAAFRTRLKDAVMCANARGFARALMNAGNPMPGLLCDPADDLLLPEWACNDY